MGPILRFALAAGSPHGLNVHVVLLIPMENSRMIEQEARRGRRRRAGDLASDRGRL